jgi:hypothetical protein
MLIAPLQVVLATAVVLAAPVVTAAVQPAVALVVVDS